MIGRKWLFPDHRLSIQDSCILEYANLPASVADEVAVREPTARSRIKTNRMTMKVSVNPNKTSALCAPSSLLMST
jgi:hypothetical protein